jgi:hypothetical protein
MENITYTKNLSCSSPWTPQKTEWFGCTGELTRNFPLKDYLKSTKNQKSETTEIFKRQEKAHNNAQNKVELNKTVAYNINHHKREILYLTQEIEKVKKTHEIISICALKIQKVARGYLARKGLEAVFFI